MDLRFIVLKVQDLKRARKFYKKLLGDDPVKEEENRMVEFEFESVKLGLYNPCADGLSLDDSDFGSNCIPSFGVENLESELERIKNFAEIVRQEKSGGHRWFTFKDSEGNLLEIHQK